MQNEFARGLALWVAVAGFTGCGTATERSGVAEAEADHEHSHEGIHGGHVIELGDENYHAELIHDDATHKVGVYLLDGTAEAAAPIDAPNVTINCRVAEQPLQFMLVAVPQPGDADGKSSYFELTSEELCQVLDNPDASARLSLTIAGKPYVGPIETSAHDHDHDHDHGHDHDHE